METISTVTNKAAQTSNTVGTVAGVATILLSSQVINWVAGTSLFIAGSAATGGAVPAAALAYAACGVGAMLVNYAVTHWTQVKLMDAEVVKLWPIISMVTPMKAKDVKPVNQVVLAPITEAVPPKEP